jgi:zinc transport system substrate-binding protein
MGRARGCHEPRREARLGMGAAGARLGLALLAGVVAAASAAPAAAGLSVVVTIKPLHALVARVMGETGSPQLLIQGTLSAHTYALKPSDASRLNAADIFFRMSEAMEPFTARVVKSLPKGVQVVTLQETPRLTLLERRSGASFEASSPGNDHGKGHHGHGHSHGHGAIDGHAWLDPVNAGQMADRITEILGARAPAQAAVFSANAARLKAELDALHAELARDLAPLVGKPYVVFHDALQYFELRYGLKPVGSIAVSPEVSPSARRLTALRARIGQGGAECVFAEPQFDTRLVTAVVEGTPARVGTIDPEGSRIEPGPDHYFTLLRNLARDLKACLAPAG